MALYHFSEEPDIREFVPRSPLARPHIEPQVWAIHERGQAMYFFPRDCPRACFWCGPTTTEAACARWFTGVTARRVIAVESAWLERIRATTLYRYTMPDDAFEPVRGDGGEDSHHYVSRQTVAPVAVEPIADLLGALAAEYVELRITPRLGPLWCAVVTSTLHFSGTRLRNAAGFPEEFPDGTSAG